MNKLIKGIACAFLVLPVSVYAKAVVINPSFEQDDFSATEGKGIINSGNPGGITGWLQSNKTTGISLASKDGKDVFANNGTIPDGVKVAFIQGDGELSQVLGGVTPGVTYKITYYENATRPKSGSGAIKLTVSADDQVIVDTHTVEPVGGTNPYRKVESKPFTAGENVNLVHLKFETSDAQGESAVLLDNVQVEVVSGEEKPNAGIQHFGFINVATQYMGDGNDIDEVGRLCNVAWIENYGPEYDIGKIPVGSTEGTVNAENAVKMVKEAAAMKMTSHVSLQYIFFDSKHHLRPDWSARWDKFSSELAPVIGDITSLSTIDEPYLSLGETTKEQLTADLATANKAIKGKFPNTPILVIYAYKTLVDIDNVVIPDGYDWLGFDGYPYACVSAHDNFEGVSVPWFYNAIRSKLRPGQRMIMIPELWYVPARPGNPKTFTLELTSNYDRVMKMAQDDPLCVAVFNFCWPTWIHPTEKNSGSSVIGTDGIPYMAEIGEMYLKKVKDPSSEIRLTPLTASDNQSDKGTVGTKAFDKNPETYWTASDSTKDTSWLLADFKEPWKVSKLRLLTYRGEGSATKKIGFSIYAGPTLGDLKLVKKIETTGDQEKIEIEIPAEIGNNVRYLKIEADGPKKESFGWREIELVESNR